MKSRSFSIYLLKDGFDATNALNAQHKLDAATTANALPPKASLFVLDGKPYSPWWKEYFDIAASLLQANKGAIVFVPVKKRCFALCFGHVAHNLRDESYEYDFGLRVTLNSVDPAKLKSTDTLQPGRSRRQRTQLPVDSDLTYFDFDRDSTILRTLTGKVKSEHLSMFAHATGASNIRLSSALPPDELPALGEKLLELYESDEFEKTFPDIQSITPIKDPTLIAALNDKLLEAVRTKDDDLNLSVPAIINFADNMLASFVGAGPSLLYDDVFMGRYYEYLSENDVDLATLTIDDIKNHRLQLTDENGVAKERHSVLRCMIFDAAMAGEAYHFTEGNWYKIDAAYVSALRSYLDPYCTEISLPSYNHGTEGAYNRAVATDSIVCLDQTSISPPLQTQVEPCDLYEVSDGHAMFRHVKVSTLSSQLSHLFSQGTNAIELYKSDGAAEAKLRALLASKASSAKLPALLSPLDEGKYHVSFAIITHKDPTKKSLNLPLFSQISLRRCLRSLTLMSVKGSFGFIPDVSPKNPGAKKKRKTTKKGP